MWSIDTLYKINREAARKARGGPKLIRSVQDINDIFEHRSAGFPYIGNKCEKFDKKHTRIDTLFVDISGFGTSGEPALTFNRLRKQLIEFIGEYGSIYVALEEQGQFQGYLAVWKAKN
jgi:hypothetical protein